MEEYDLNELAGYLEAFSGDVNPINTGLVAGVTRQRQLVGDENEYGLPVDWVSGYVNEERCFPAADVRAIARMRMLGLDVPDDALRQEADFVASKGAPLGGLGATPGSGSAIPQSYGIAVKGVQASLARLGYKGRDGKALGIDGAWGSNSKFALDAYLAARGKKTGKTYKYKISSGLVWLSYGGGLELWSEAWAASPLKNEYQKLSAAKGGGEKFAEISQKKPHKTTVRFAKEIISILTGTPVVRDLEAQWAAAAKARRLPEFVSVRGNEFNTNAKTFAALNAEYAKKAPRKKIAVRDAASMLTTLGHKVMKWRIDLVPAWQQAARDAGSPANAFIKDGFLYAHPDTYARLTAGATAITKGKLYSKKAAFNKEILSPEQQAQKISSKVDDEYLRRQGDRILRRQGGRIFVGEKKELSLSDAVGVRWVQAQLVQAGDLPAKSKSGRTNIDGAWGALSDKAYNQWAKARGVDAYHKFSADKQFIMVRPGAKASLMQVGAVTPKTAAAPVAPRPAQEPAPSAPRVGGDLISLGPAALRVAVDDVQKILIGLGASPARMTDGKWGDTTRTNYVKYAERNGVDPRIQKIDLRNVYVLKDAFAALRDKAKAIVAGRLQAKKDAAPTKPAEGKPTAPDTSGLKRESAGKLQDILIALRYNETQRTGEWGQNLRDMWTRAAASRAIDGTIERADMNAAWVSPVTLTALLKESGQPGVGKPEISADPAKPGVPGLPAGHTAMTLAIFRKMLGVPAATLIEVKDIWQGYAKKLHKPETFSIKKAPDRLIQGRQRANVDGAIVAVETADAIAKDLQLTLAAKKLLAQSTEPVAVKDIIDLFRQMSTVAELAGKIKAPAPGNKWTEVVKNDLLVYANVQNVMLPVWEKALRQAVRPIGKTGADQVLLVPKLAETLRRDIAGMRKIQASKIAGKKREDEIKKGMAAGERKSVEALHTKAKQVAGRMKTFIPVSILRKAAAGIRAAKAQGAAAGMNAPDMSVTGSWHPDLQKWVHALWTRSIYGSPVVSVELANEVKKRTVSTHSLPTGKQFATLEGLGAIMPTGILVPKKVADDLLSWAASWTEDNEPTSATQGEGAYRPDETRRLTKKVTQLPFEEDEEILIQQARAPQGPSPAFTAEPVTDTSAAGGQAGGGEAAGGQAGGGEAAGGRSETSVTGPSITGPTIHLNVPQAQQAALSPAAAAKDNKVMLFGIGAAGLVAVALIMSKKKDQ